MVTLLFKQKGTHLWHAKLLEYRPIFMGGKPGNMGNLSVVGLFAQDHRYAVLAAPK